MRERSTAGYGTWDSPITAEMITESGVGLLSVSFCRGNLYWLESRPEEGGRSVLLRRGPDGEVVVLTPEGMSVRSRAHEYGGGAYAVRDEVVLFVNDEDQRLYRQEGDAAPVPVTPEPPRPRAIRYADGCFTADGRHFVCVRETHAEGSEAKNEIVAVPVSGAGETVVLFSGRDFYSFPRLSPTGDRITFTTWDHPAMPWDGTELFVAELAPDLTTGEPSLVAGGPRESIYQPGFGPDGTLYFVSDRSGWWNLHRLADGSPENLRPVEAEAGVPQWNFGTASFAFLDDGRIVLREIRPGGDRLVLLRPGDPAVAEVRHPFESLGSPVAGGDRIYILGAGPDLAPELCELDPEGAERKILARSLTVLIDPEFLTVPEPITFPTAGGAFAHALYYPPKNRDFTGPEGERPPLVVLSHGGPTSSATAELNLKIQYFTSRGFAVADVNYRGSTGYGRAFREALNGKWGIADVEDCAAVARHLVAKGRVDPRRLAIRGGSAGGYTTLAALAFEDVFHAGVSYYGVADLSALARDTHKFESRYLDSLVGPWPAAEEIYRARSPLFHADRLSCPILLLQGLEDAVVPPAQAEQMAAALARRGIPHAYVAFPGEQHGFRKAETIRRALMTELAFYGRIFGFTPADDLPEVPLSTGR